MAGSTRAAAVLAALLTAGLVTGAPALASAAPGPTPAPSASSSASPTPTPTPSRTAAPPDPAVQALAARVLALQRAADRAGEAAQKAAERANDARAASDAAADHRAEARTAAAAAADRARASRARASALAAQLARTNLGTMPLDLLLNGRTAEGVLGGLSTTGQLSVQARLLFDRARADRIEAERLQRVAEARADEAAAAADAAERTADAAKREAAAAERSVQGALAEQRALLAGPADAAVCAAVGAAAVGSCAVSQAPAPSGGSVGADVVRYALAQIGKPYVFAAAGPDAYDCSGLTLAAYASAGVPIGIHSATAQYRRAAEQGDLVPLSAVRPGDLLFYTDGGGDMYHVTIAAGEGLMIEAPYPGASVRQVPIRTGDLVPRAAHFG